MQEEGVNTYDKAVDTAQTLQDIVIMIANCRPASQFCAAYKKKNPIHQSRQNMSIDKIFSLAINQDILDFCKINEITEHCQLYSRFGHTANRCFKWQRANARHDQRFNRYDRYKNDHNTITGTQSQETITLITSAKEQFAL